MRQLVYTMFISNNPASFHLWWKESLVKHHKYYTIDCGSYYCSRADNQQPTYHYPTSLYPSDTIGYCYNLLFSRFTGRCPFFLEGFRASQKLSFSPVVFLNHMIVHKYMINTELYSTFWKYIDKLPLEKNWDKSVNIPMNSHINQQSFQSTANLILQSAPIPTKIDFYHIFLNSMFWKRCLLFFKNSSLFINRNILWLLNIIN